MTGTSCLTAPNDLAKLIRFAETATRNLKGDHE
jgi:hypothetical protein